MRRVERPGGLLRLSLLRDPLLRFSMLVYLCVPGTFIGINVVGMFYLQSVTGMSPSAIGALMLPWSLAFVCGDRDDRPLFQFVSAPARLSRSAAFSRLSGSSPWLASMRIPPTVC